jgi:hypothetical protein
MPKRPTKDRKDERVIIAPGGPKPASAVHYVRPGEGVRGVDNGDLEIVSERGSRFQKSNADHGQRTLAIPQDYVMTPGGLRHRSNVHLIEAGHMLDASEGRLRALDPNCRVVREIGPVERQRFERAFLPNNLIRPRWQVPDLGTGWIVYTGWWNNTGRPISSFETAWTVPSSPLSRSGQLIYLFNGIQNDAYIYQPVLQWGSNGADGGEFWQVATWYVSLKTAVHSTFVRVNPGDVLIGVMTLTGRTPTGFNYFGEFRGIPGSGYSITGQQELKWACETLEAYGVTRASDYPARKIAMRSIEIQTGATPPTVNWAAVNAVTDCGQEAVVVSNASPGGEVDLFCYDLKHTAVSRNVDGRFEQFYTNRNDGLYHRWQVAPSNGWANDWPMGFGNYAKQIIAALNQDGRLELFYVGTNDRVYHNWQTAPNNGWSGEHWLDGWAKQIAIERNADGRLEVFYVGTNNKLYHNWQTGPNNGWSGESELGGWAKQIVAARNADGRLEVFYVGTNDRVYHNWQTAPNNGWSGEGWMGSWAKQVAVGQNADGRLEVFYIGTDDRVYHNWQTAPNNGWSGENWMGGWAKQVVVGQNADGRLEVVYIGTDDHLYHRWQIAPNSGWSSEATLGGAAREISLGNNADGRLELIYVGTNGVLYQNWQVAPNGGWSGERRV